MGNVYNMVGGGGGIKLVSIAVTTPPTKNEIPLRREFRPRGNGGNGDLFQRRQAGRHGLRRGAERAFTGRRDECHDPIYRGRKERHSLPGRDRDPETRLDCSHHAAHKDGVSLRRGVFHGGNGRKGHLYGREHGGGNGLHDEPIDLYLPRGVRASP